MRNRWFHRPILHTEHDHEKKVSWLELFYDLIFVAAIIQLGDALSDQVSETHKAFGPMAMFAAHMAPLWLAWSGFTFYANRFDVDDFFHRALVLAKMFAVAAMAISAPHAMHGDPTTFAIAFAVVQAMVAVMHIRAYFQVPDARDYSLWWGGVFAIGAVLWGISVPLSTPWCYVLWAAGGLAILISPVHKVSRAISERYPIDMEHLSERFGLLTIIVLGESFVKVLSYLAGKEHGSEMEYLTKAFVNLAITCCLWWIYFDDVAGSKLKKGRGSWIMWFYGHLPMFISLTAVGVAVKKTIGLDFAEVAPPEYRWLLAGSLAAVLFSVALIDSVTERREAELSDRARVNVRFFSAALVMLMGQAGGTMSAGTFIGLLATICAAQVLFDMMSAPFTDDHEEEHAISTAALARQRAAEAVARSGERKTRPDLGDAVRKGTPAELRRDAYFFFMEGSWTRLWIVFGGIYLLSNVFFASLYLVEPTSIAMDGEITFADAFFFSVQTMSTIGYGAMHPTTEYGDMIVTIEAAFGLLSVALATGLMFAKASRPTSSVLFAEDMVLTTMHGQRTLMMRCGNARGNEIVEASLDMSCLLDEISDEGHHIRRVHDLKLTRSKSPIFSLSWTAMHVIDETSPLWGIPEDELEDHVLAIIIVLLGHDATYGQTSHARKLYYPENIRVNHRYVDVIHQLEDGRMMIDYTIFHETILDEDAAEVIAEEMGHSGEHDAAADESDKADDRGDDDDGGDGGGASFGSDPR